MIFENVRVLQMKCNANREAQPVFVNSEVEGAGFYTELENFKD